MKRFHLILTVLATSLTLTSCFKDDERVEPHPRGNVIEATLAMTQNYQYQIFYDLSAAKETGKQLKTSHDLLFDNAANGWRVRLNTSLFMKVAHTASTDFRAINDTTGARWLFDKSDGNPDSNAIGVWLDTLSFTSRHEVMLLDRGLDLVGRSRGIYKLVIDSVDGQGYTLRFGKLTDTTAKQVRLTKNPPAAFAGLLLDADGNPVDAEPPADDWDLLFTQYTTLLFTDLGEAYPYLVTGVLINQQRIEVAVDSITSFAGIDLGYASTLTYSAQSDIIGYDWKQVQGDVTSGNVTYTIRPNLTYLIREKEGYIYKLRFTAFYSSETGEKGYPRVEFQRL